MLMPIYDGRTGITASMQPASLDEPRRRIRFSMDVLTMILPLKRRSVERRFRQNAHFDRWQCHAVAITGSKSPN